MLLSMVQKSTADRSFNASVYQQMVQSSVSHEKLECVVAHLAQMRGILQSRADQSMDFGTANGEGGPMS